MPASTSTVPGTWGIVSVSPSHCTAPAVIAKRLRPIATGQATGDGPRTRPHLWPVHAGSLDCDANPIGGTCTVSEYGDPFDVMGNQAAMHFNAFQKTC